MKGKNYCPLKLRFLFTFLFTCLSLVFLPQSPGGVKSPKYWYCTDKGSWKEVYRSENKLTASDTLSINFHPARLFNSVAKINDLNLKNQQTFFGIFHPGYNSGATTPSSKIFLDLRYSNTTYTALHFDSLIKRKVFTSTSYFPNFIIDGSASSRETALKVVSFETGNHVNTNIWGSDPDTVTVPFKGYFPELIVYDRKLNTTLLERERVETYLAIKYGVTLDLENKSYIGNNREVILKKENMAAYKYRICAIGRADSSGLWQHLSNTSYEEVNLSYKYHSTLTNPKRSNNRSVTIGFSDPDKNKIANNRYVFWGDNNGEVALKDTMIVITTSLTIHDSSKIEILKRNWFIYNKYKLKDPTNVQISGNVVDVLEKKEYAYFILKRDKPIDRTSFIVLDSAQYCYYNKISWDEKVPFTFGRVPKLKAVQIVLCHNYYPEKDSLGYIKSYDLDIDFTFKWFRGGYWYRNHETEILSKCDENSYPYFWDRRMNSKQVEIYFKGGVGPFEIKIYDSQNQPVSIVSKEIIKGFYLLNKNPHNEIKERVNIAVITTPLPANKLGKWYTVVVTDAIQEVIKIPVIIK